MPLLLFKRIDLEKRAQNKPYFGKIVRKRLSNLVIQDKLLNDHG